MMQANVGIIRNGPELDDALVQLDSTFSERVANLKVTGGRAYNPGWNLATDLPSMITVSKCVTRGAIQREESRGGHTREDFPKASAEFGTFNLAHSVSGGTYDGEFATVRSPLLTMPDELKALLEEAK